ncbi:MAG: hypothetical protein LBH25_14830 [Fibromonadaceae bacterium]|nr:hypothetical protein [Fibromonadaceae bacterium]
MHCVIIKAKSHSMRSIMRLKLRMILFQNKYIAGFSNWSDNASKDVIFTVNGLDKKLNLRMAYGDE